MKERRQRKSLLDAAQAEWTIIGGDGGIPDEAANLIADLLLDAAEEQMAREAAVPDSQTEAEASVREEVSMDRTTFLQHLQRYVANIAIGGSTLRNQGAPGVIETARRFLGDLDLQGIPADRYPQWLDAITCKLQAAFPKGARKWGAARKAINVFLCHAFMNRELSNEYDLVRLGEVLETPLDSLAAKKLCDCAGSRKLPRWLGVGRLTEEVSRAYQDFALEKARQEGIPRACMDVLLWTRNK